AGAVGDSRRPASSAAWRRRRSCCCGGLPCRHLAVAPLTERLRFRRHATRAAPGWALRRVHLSLPLRTDSPTPDPSRKREGGETAPVSLPKVRGRRDHTLARLEDPEWPLTVQQA